MKTAIPESTENDASVQHPEEGSALVIALLAVVVMTILGLVLMDVLRGGQVQAATSEAHIQAEAIAQKGLDDALTVIRDAVAKGSTGTYREKIANTDLYLDAAIGVLDHSVGSDEQHPNDNNGEVVSANKGSYQIDVISQTKVTPINATDSTKDEPITNPDFPYSRKLIIHSRGTIGNQPETVVAKTMTVYVSSINPVFRYPVSSGQGLGMNGSPYVIGDLLVRGGNVNISNEAQFVGSAQSRYGILSGLPAVRGFLRVDGDPVTLPKRYFLKKDNIDQTPSSSLDPGFFTSKYFPLEDPTLDNDLPVDIEGFVNQKVFTDLNQRYANKSSFDETYAGSFDQLGYTLNASSSHNSMLFDGQWLSVFGDKANNQKVTIAPKTSGGTADLFVEDGVLSMERTTIGGKTQDPDLAITNGNLYIRSYDSNLIAADLRGKLEMDKDNYLAIQGNVTLNDGFEFPQGSMYIKGDLKVIGNITLQGTVYVDGNVELKEMKSINKKVQPTDDPSPLIIAASGDIVLGNNTNSANGDEEIRAFLYSERGMRLYGVISKLNLTGGVHGSQGVELNAVRGDLDQSTGVKPNVRTIAGSPWAGPTVLSGQDTMAANTSRLQIVYDNNLYDKPPSGIPTMNALNVFVKETQFLDK